MAHGARRTQAALAVYEIHLTGKGRGGGWIGLAGNWHGRSWKWVANQFYACLNWQTMELWLQCLLHTNCIQLPITINTSAPLNVHVVPDCTHQVHSVCRWLQALHLRTIWVCFKTRDWSPEMVIFHCEAGDQPLGNFILKSTHLATSGCFKTSGWSDFSWDYPYCRFIYQDLVQTILAGCVDPYQSKLHK